ncbi:hypothetical protein NHX12_012295 [Muraenolepis orangiensis]|uniref:Ig-like domain-containing protein n=1 Tax=Muraenolepis orangiensis TaxID=630683 RepID=A0A9Q0DFV6_9TELE|nr:hypothetical protein NHX12_012295 [Muraenolepis orangiensis]
MPEKDIVRRSSGGTWAYPPIHRPFHLNEDNSLLLPDLRSNDSGTYSCFIGAKVGGKNKQSFVILKVPVCVTEPTQIPKPKEKATPSAKELPVMWTVLCLGSICIIKLIIPLIYIENMLPRNGPRSYGERSKVGGVSLSDKCLDLESRSRRQNVRLVGIEEGNEGNNPRQFCATVLKEILELEDVPRLDRGHRTLAPKPREGERPRPFVIRVHHGDVKDRILRLSSQKKQLFYKNKRVYIFPNFAPEVA